MTTPAPEYATPATPAQEPSPTTPAQDDRLLLYARTRCAVAREARAWLSEQPGDHTEARAIVGAANQAAFSGLAALTNDLWREILGGEPFSYQDSIAVARAIRTHYPADRVQACHSTQGENWIYVPFRRARPEALAIRTWRALAETFPQAYDAWLDSMAEPLVCADAPPPPTAAHTAGACAQ